MVNMVTAPRRPTDGRRRARRLVLAFLAIILSLGVPAVIAVQPGAAYAAAYAAPEPCNTFSVDWPDCMATEEQLDRALRPQRDHAYFWTGAIGGQGGECVVTRANAVRGQSAE